MRVDVTFVLALSACVMWAQDASSERARLASILDFELGAQAGGAPVGWGGNLSNGTVMPPDAGVIADDKTVHGGKWSARIELDAKSQAGYSSMIKAIPVDFVGKSLELRGVIRTERVSNYVGLFMQEDGDSPRLAFDNMQGRHVNGTTDWTEYSMKLPLRPAAKQLYFGFLLVGPGKAWVDDLQLLVDGRPIWEAPERPKPSPEDHEFDLGSRISITALSPLQIQNLVTLGKVWGFLKYHHRAVTGGVRQWDYDLFRVLPAILGAPDRAAANSALIRWINSLGAVTACISCTGLNADDIQMRPDIDWISRGSVLGNELSTLLTTIHRNRADDQQFYVAALFPGAGNPIFQEQSYKDVRFPDAGYQLLALYRFWNIIEYWFPYRDVLGQDWDQVLAEFIPRLALARDFEAYQRELLALIARAHDTHAALSTALQMLPPRGECLVPASFRFVENQFVVTASRDPGLRAGDVFLELDGQSVEKLVDEWTPYYPGSNEASLRRTMSALVTRGKCGDATMRFQRRDASFELKTQRVRSAPERPVHELAGNPFRLLSPDVAYLKMSTARVADAPRYIESAAGTTGLIIDLRNYPSESLSFPLGWLLVDHDTPFAWFTVGDLSNPGAFHWNATPVSIAPARSPHYSGKVVILVDEITQSSAEYHAMAFRAAPNAIVIGSTTAGADGNISPFPLPGGLSTQISGIGVFYPDKRPTQRVGIVPDITVRATIAGIRDGRDEVLETALRQILGSDIPESRIRELSKP